jgi:hypothetical protein
MRLAINTSGRSRIIAISSKDNLSVLNIHHKRPATMQNFNRAAIDDFFANNFLAPRCNLGLISRFVGNMHQIEKETRHPTRWRVNNWNE